MSDGPVQAQAAAARSTVPSFLRVLADEVMREAARVAREVLPEDPPRWREPRGGDAMEAFDLRRASRQVAAGRSVADAALEVAVARAVRRHGRRPVRDALTGTGYP